ALAAARADRRLSLFSRQRDALAHQSGPSTSPPCGVMAELKVCSEIDGLTMRVLPSPIATSKPPALKAWPIAVPKQGGLLGKHCMVTGGMTWKGVVGGEAK